jgi:hypothetical protein
VSTASELLIDSLMTALGVVRRVEESNPADIPHEFGNLKDSEHGATPRIVWIHEGGTVVERVTVSAADGEPLPLGTRIARYRARLRFKTKEECELVLDQLVRAVRTLANADRIILDGQTYDFVTQREGRHSEGSQLLDAFGLIRVPIPAEPIGTTREVTVTGSQFRAGIENPVGEDPNSPGAEYDVNTWTG